MKFGEILKVAGSTIFEEEEQPKEESAPVPAHASAPVSLAPATQLPLRERVLTGNTPYVSFLTQIGALEKLIPDKEQRCAIALVTLGALQTSSKDIISAIDKHMTILNAEKKLFEDSVKTESENNLTERRATISALVGQIEQKNREIKTLESQIAELGQNVSNQQSLVREQEIKIENIKHAFSDAYDKLSQQMADDKQQFLKGKA